MFRDSYGLIFPCLFLISLGVMGFIRDLPFLLGHFSWIKYLSMSCDSVWQASMASNLLPQPPIPPSLIFWLDAHSPSPCLPHSHSQLDFLLGIGSTSAGQHWAHTWLAEALPSRRQKSRSHWSNLTSQSQSRARDWCKLSSWLWHCGSDQWEEVNQVTSLQPRVRKRRGSSEKWDKVEMKIDRWVNK